MKFNPQQLLLTNQQRTPVNLVQNASEATLYIYDVIDKSFGIGAASVIAAMAEIKDAKVLNIRINSPGGDVFEGRAIMEAIRRFEGKTIAHIDSLAASAATSIALAADQVVMSEGALFMIHNASAMVWGDKNDMRQTADLLEKVEGAIVADYTHKTGMDEASIAAMMDAETWMTAKEALAHGFIDSISKTTKTKNTWNLSVFSKAPVQEPDKSGQSDTNRNKLRLIETEHS